MLQVEHRELLGGVLVVSSRQIDVAVTHFFRHRGVVVNFIDRALRHVLHSVEVFIGCRNVDTTSPTAGTIVIFATRVGNRSSINIELIIVEALILRCRLTSPNAIGILHHVIFHTTYVEFYTCGIWC